MAKLSQQLINTTEEQARATRTHRLLYQFKQKQEQAKKFEELKSKAEEYKETEFKNIKSIEEYTEKYNLLPNELKPFFKSPQELIQEKEQQKAKQYELFEERVKQYKQNIENINKSEKAYLDWVNRRRAMGIEISEKEVQERLRQYELDRDYYAEAIGYASQDKSLIEQGYISDYIWAEAERHARYNRYNKEEEDRISKEFQKKLEKGELIEQIEILKKAGVIKSDNIKYRDYVQAVGKYNLKVEENLKKQAAIENKLKKYGWEKLTPAEKEAYSKSLYEWEQEHPTEKLIISRETGQLVGIESGLFKKTYTLEGYEKEANSLNEQQKIELENDKKASEFLESKGIQVPNLEKKESLGKELLKDIFTMSFIYSSPKEKIKGIGNIVKTLGGVASASAMPFALDVTATQKQYTSLKEKITTSTSYFENLKTAWKFVEESKNLNYREQSLLKYLKDVEKASSEAPEELKEKVILKGYEKLKEAGVDVQEISENGKTYLKISDEALQQRLTGIKWEYLEALKTPSKSDELQLLVGYGAFKGAETYLLTKGLIKGFSFFGGGAKGTGLYRSVETTGGVARVPITTKDLMKPFGTAFIGAYAYKKIGEYKAEKEISPKTIPIFWAGTIGEIAGFELATGTITNYMTKKINNISNFERKTINQAPIGAEEFYNPQIKKYVYPKRFEGFKLNYPKSWYYSIAGYKKGQFVGWQYKVVADEVLAYYQYGTKEAIKVYPKETKFKLFSEEPKTKISPIKTIKPTKFPYDIPETHYKWFASEGKKRFYLPKEKELKDILKIYKYGGYHATPEKWESYEFKPIKFEYNGKIYEAHPERYISGKGVSVAFTRVYKQVGESSGLAKKPKKPIIYLDYAKNLEKLKAIKEIKIKDIETGRQLKTYLFPKKLKAGTIYLPLKKMEVEGVLPLEKVIPIRQKHAVKLAGWKIPIDEEIALSSTLTPKLKTILNKRGISPAPKSAGTSSLPVLKTSYPFIISTTTALHKSANKIKYLKGYSGSIGAYIHYPHYMKKTTVSYIQTTKAPRSYISISKAPRSYISISKAPRSYISISKISKTHTPMENLFFNFKIDIKKTKGIKRKAKPLQIKALMPDFTARTLGFAPQQYAEKQAVKEIKKILTGLEIRKGGALKKFK